MQVRPSPAFCPTVRTNYGSGLSLFLATCPSDGVPAKLANHRDGRHRGWRFRANAEFLPATSAFELSRWRDGRCGVGCPQTLLVV